jgi:hypothetical protein
MDRSKVHKIRIYQLQQVFKAEGNEGMSVFAELKKMTREKAAMMSRYCPNNCLE